MKHQQIALARIGRLAVTFLHREVASAMANEDLRAACKEFRAQRCHGQHIPRGTDLYSEMRTATSLEGAALALAKNEEQTAKRALDAAAREYLKEHAR